MTKRIPALHAVAVLVALTGLPACSAASSVASPASPTASAAAVSGSPTVQTSNSAPVSAPRTTVSPRADVIKKSAPSASARMICNDETRKNVALLFGVRTPPPSSATFVNGLYTCRYVTANGPLTLSVMDSADVPTASTYFTAERARIGATRRLDGMTGLGLPAYESTRGVVTFLKDHMTLVVDARALTGSIGPEHHTPADLAYTIATDVLACWNGD